MNCLSSRQMLRVIRLRCQVAMVLFAVFGSSIDQAFCQQIAKESVSVEKSATAATDPTPNSSSSRDHLFEIQSRAIEANQSSVAHWGWEPTKFTQWDTHSNRLVPVYTFGTLGQGDGIDLSSYIGENSVYRSVSALQDLYGRLPRETHSADADYMDQTDIYRLQVAAKKAGKRNIILLIFDGMDWQTTQAASIYNKRKVLYESGRGIGTSFQEYDANGTSQFGFMVTSPYCDGMGTQVDTQTIDASNVEKFGGYRSDLGGKTPWATTVDQPYLAAKMPESGPAHAYTDSASSATSMMAGIKTYNGAINIDATGKDVVPLARQLQDEGWKVGVVTSVPVSHATPGAAYANNVHRSDYQDITRDLIGRPSIRHPQVPLSGLDVILGTGFGVIADADEDQGQNYVSGNVYLTEEDRQAIDVEHGGRYQMAIRHPGLKGSVNLQVATQEAIKHNRRLFGYFGVASSKHLPFETANRDFQPAAGKEKTSETYSTADIEENPTLAEMTSAALQVLSKNEKGFWLMVEAGDVDWASHDNNLDNAIGAVNSGDRAFQAITAWVEEHSNWDETLVIVTADHGHLLNVTLPLGVAGDTLPSGNDEGGESP